MPNWVTNRWPNLKKMKNYAKHVQTSSSHRQYCRGRWCLNPMWLLPFSVSICVSSPVRLNVVERDIFV